MNQTLRNFITEGPPEDVIERYESLPELAKEADFGALDTNVVVIDTETTGVSIKKDELTQIAAARLEKGEITEWFVTFVNPGQHIPDEISHLTGIYDDDVEDAPFPDEALRKLVEFVGDAKLVAHNAEFDKNFTTKHPSGYPLLENTWIDSLDLARIALPRMRSHRLLDLVKAFGAPLSTHRADDDVAATCALYRILLAAVSVMPAPLLRQISLLTTPDIWPTATVFSHFALEDTKRYAEEHGLEIDEVHPPHFSLRTMRKDRLASLKETGTPKIDPLANDETASGQDDHPIELKFPDPEEIITAFSAEGALGKLYDDYEQREEQLEMALAVSEAFAASTNLMVEAGTGVGKSLAYLIPAVMTAKENNLTVGIATKTNALLDQLIFKELPLLSKLYDGNLVYTSLKGFSHYPCLRRIQNIANEGAEIVTVQNEERTQAPAIAALLSFIEQTTYGDLDSLKIDYRALPKRQITTTSHDCMRRKCPFYGTYCFVHGQRRHAETADIVVTNHSLLFCDIAADNGLLPPIRFWVVDEAHGAENEARRALSQVLSVDELNQIAARVGDPESSRNIFVRTERNVVAPADALSAGSINKSDDPGTLFYALTSKAKKAGAQFAEAEAFFASEIKELFYFDTQKKSSYDMVDIWINEEVRNTTAFAALSNAADKLIDSCEKLINSCQELVGFLEDMENAAVIQREIASIALDLKCVCDAANIIFVHPSDSYVYSATLSRRSQKKASNLPTGRFAPTHNSIEAQPYNVGMLLEDTLYAHTKSVVFTSATLAVDNTFHPFEVAMGLNTSDQTRTEELYLRSSYDFNKNMIVYVLKDMPDPNSSGYLEKLQELLVELHRAQNGSMLTLFTNKKDMEACYSEVNQQLKQDDLRLVCQRWGVSTKGLRDDFLADEHLSLFALKSFWEGFDAPGATLKGVTIPKLPFSKPTDPLSCERASRDDYAWRNYVLPQAVLEVKQAAGRLIRRADDTGTLILADSRLATKGYGKAFLNSLPSQNIHMVTCEEAIVAVAQANDVAEGKYPTGVGQMQELQEPEDSSLQAGIAG